METGDRIIGIIIICQDIDKIIVIKVKKRYLSIISS